ncbi:hypothetical protein CKW39_08795 [Kocuria sp. WRN011]|uniref:hypothetical protein n=1 Tax=Kocuria sp. WRN011 TaxID=2029858 RepID=UPI000BAFDE15|nr:hypothetical protein [Kocuria sp. WRN011]PBB08449.1 hypothetical protein CKW39_08795 [Kocuria sp. WRN011]
MGYKYRDPNRIGQPLFTETDKRMHELEQENAQLRQQRFQARRQVEKLAQELDYYKKRGRELGQERVQAVKKVAGRVGVNHGRVLNLLATLRSERQVLAGERSRRQHAEQALSRSEQRTDKVRTELDRERTTHRQTVVGLQETVAGLEETIGELRARLAQRHEVVTENRVAQLQGALADQQQITADRTRERDMARGEAIGAYSLLDEAHALLTRKQLQVFEAQRLARLWGIDFEQPESEVA